MNTSNHKYQQAERALMLDMGRKHFTKDWILKVIDYMSQLELNTLQLHFSDFQGFRIAFDTVKPSQDHHSKEDIREIIDYAVKHGIQVIPDFDTPGHLTHILASYPEYQLDEIKDGQLVKLPSALNIADKNAREFIKKIYKEAAELFGHSSKYFHIGADEFIEFDKVENFPQLVEYAKEKYGENASGLETYVEYTNEIIDYVIGLGYTPRIWNDGFYRKNRQSLVELDNRAQVTYWTSWDKNMAEVEVFIDKGFEIINFCDNYFYYVLGELASYTYPTAEKIKEEWSVNRFSGGQFLSDEQMKSVVGTSFAIWCDGDLQTQEEVWDGIQAPLKAMAEKLLKEEK